MEKYPSWPKGSPGKGSRSLIAAQGSNPSFSVFEFLNQSSKKVIDKHATCDNTTSCFENNSETTLITKTVKHIRFSKILNESSFKRMNFL